MQIDFCIYHLQPLKTLNRFSSSIRRGVFLRIGKKFFLDYHPWKEFGDISVEEMLKCIKESRKLPGFLEQLLALEQDRFNTIDLPFLNHSLDLAEEKQILGEDRVKLKYLGDLEELRSCLLKNRSRTLRVDFNNALSETEFIGFWESLPLEVQNAIEFFEDPVPLVGDNWKKFINLGIPLACDRNFFNELHFDFKIFKPNIERYQPLEKPIIFSSYMGHDLGRYQCYLSLMNRADLKLFHGVDTPCLYSEQIDLFARDGNFLKLNKRSRDVMYKKLKGLEWNSLI